LAGLAISTKYNAAMITTGIVAAHFLARREEGTAWHGRELGKLFAAGGVCVAVFLAGSPVWLIQPAKTLATLRETAAHMTGGHYFVPGETPYCWIAHFLLREETAIGALGIAGLICAAIRHRKAEIVLLVPILASAAVIGTWQKQSPYYLLMIWPALLTLGTVAMADASRRFDKRLAVTVTLAAVIVAFPLYRAVSMGRESLREDNRIAAEQWIQQNMPQGAQVGTDWGYMPALWDADFMAEAAERRREQFAGNPDLEIWQRFAERTRSFHLVPLEFSADWLKEADLDYVITSSMCYHRFLSGEPPSERHPFREGYLAHRRFYESLFEGGAASPYVEIMEFGEGSGPIIRIHANTRHTDESSEPDSEV